MKGGNGVREANGITHSPTGEQNDCPVHAHRGAGTRQSPAAKEISRKVREVREVLKNKASRGA